MNRIFVLIGLVMLLSCGFADAKSDKGIASPIKFNGTKFNLLYSAKSAETGGYLNEYYKANQTYASWTELIGVHHYPTAFYPIEHARDFTSYLESTGVATNIEVDEKNNTALVYFVITNDRRLPVIMEFNIFKYQKSPVCGTIGLQYAKRYCLNNPLEVRKAKKELIKSGVKYIGKVSRLSIPSVITVDIENGELKNAEVKDQTSVEINNVQSEEAENIKPEEKEQTKSEEANSISEEADETASHAADNNTTEEVKK